jgi:hypothetical protein
MSNEQLVELTNSKVARLAEAADTAQEQPVEHGSEAALLDELTKPRQWSSAVSNALWGSVDHLQTLVDLLRLPVRPLAPYTLLRAAVENASLALWLVAPSERETRLLRALRLAIADVRDSGPVHEIAGNTIDPVAVRVAKIVSAGKRAGLTDTQLKQKDSWTEIVTAADRVFHRRGDRAVEFSWRAGSGIMHARDWARMAVLERGEVIDDGGETLTMSVTTSFTAVLYSVMATERIILEVTRLSNASRRAGMDFQDTASVNPESG